MRFFSRIGATKSPRRGDPNARPDFNKRYADTDGDKIIDVYRTSRGGQVVWHDINEFSGLPRVILDSVQ